MQVRWERGRIEPAWPAWKDPQDHPRSSLRVRRRRSARYGLHGCPPRSSTFQPLRAREGRGGCRPVPAFDRAAQADGGGGRLRRSARPTQPRRSTLRSSHNPDPTERVIPPHPSHLDNREVPLCAGGAVVDASRRSSSPTIRWAGRPSTGCSRCSRPSARSRCVSRRASRFRRKRGSPTCGCRADPLPSGRGCLRLVHRVGSCRVVTLETGCRTRARAVDAPPGDHESLADLDDDVTQWLRGG